MAPSGPLALPDRVRMRRLLDRLGMTRAPAAVVLVRLLVGGVFISQGLQMFLFPEALGLGRFIKIGLPAASFMAPFAGVTEIVCGILLTVGFLTRVAAVPLIVVILVAIRTTKVPILIKSGFWAMAHEARTDPVKARLIKA